MKKWLYARWCLSEGNPEDYDVIVNSIDSDGTLHWTYEYNGTNYTRDFSLFSNEINVVDYQITPAGVQLAYLDGVYSETQNKIYLIPFSQSDEAVFHYIDCSDGSVNTYANTEISINNAYTGGVYDPVNDRIWFVPGANMAAQSVWHYLDCATGIITGYTHGVGTISGYWDGVYSPNEQRIYFSPYAQSDDATWHYIDCATATVSAYTHVGYTAVDQGYNGAVYHQELDRVYFVPNKQANQSIWHYIDCSTGELSGYTSITGISTAYQGGVYDPVNAKVYFSPFNQAPEPQWHYIDSNGDVTLYDNTTNISLTSYYSKGVYNNGKIFFGPRRNETTWHYVNTSDNSIVSYNSPTTDINPYSSAIFCSQLNRIYFIPYGQADQTQWHYIKIS